MDRKAYIYDPLWLQECLQQGERLGKKCGSDFGIPVNTV